MALGVLRPSFSHVYSTFCEYWTDFLTSNTGWLFPTCSVSRYQSSRKRAQMQHQIRLTELQWADTRSSIPLALMRVPAGFPSPAEGEEDDPIDLNAWLIEQPAATYLMRVEGWSMTGAGINDGDLVAVSRAKQAIAGDVVVAVVHGDRTLKRLKKLDGRFWLVPEAEGYPHLEVDEYIEIWGVVVGLVRRYRR